MPEPDRGRADVPHVVSPEQWRRVSAIFAVARELPEAEQQAYLAVACAGHPEDRGALDALLASDAADPAFLEPGPSSSPPWAPGFEPEPGPFTPGQQVGRYRILRRLKPGGMSTLYVAEDNLHREVVVKVLLPEFAPVRLRREAEAMARVKHENIATVYGFEDAEDPPFLVTEYVVGRNLRERLEEEGPCDPPAVINLGLAVARALRAAHAAGVIHRDLKPENIMLSGEEGVVKLVDFGIARVLPTLIGAAGTPTAYTTIIGTPAYMSPEQIQAGHIDARCDIFSLGIVLYEIATGCHPFTGRSTATTLVNILQLQQPTLASRRALNFGLLETVVSRCLRKAPAQRYGSAAELLAALEEARQVVSGARPAPAPASHPDPARLWWWRFHQCAVAVTTGALLEPVWLVRERLDPGPIRNVIFFAALAAAVVSILARLHAAFEARDRSRRSARAFLKRRYLLVRGVDALYSLVVAGAALLVIAVKPGLAALLLTIALGLLVTMVLIEPVTTHRAFDDECEEEDEPPLPDAHRASWPGARGRGSRDLGA